MEPSIDSDYYKLRNDNLKQMIKCVEREILTAKQNYLSTTQAFNRYKLEVASELSKQLSIIPVSIIDKEEIDKLI